MKRFGMTETFFFVCLIPVRPCIVKVEHHLKYHFCDIISVIYYICNLLTQRDKTTASEMMYLGFVLFILPYALLCVFIWGWDVHSAKQFVPFSYFLKKFCMYNKINSSAMFVINKAMNKMIQLLEWCKYVYFYWDDSKERSNKPTLLSRLGYI